MKKLMFPLAVVALMSGCATVKYDCELKTEVQAKCASMQDAYRVANGPQAQVKNRQSVFEGQTSQTQAAAGDTGARPYFKGEESGFPEPGERGMPVFKQPKVHRVWVAPYVDSDGNLRSGEYAYFSTPGEWNYGTTRRAGEASGIFGPAKQDAYGFAPVDKKNDGKKPAAPPTPQSSSKQTADHVDGITQPAQRITQ